MTENSYLSIPSPGVLASDTDPQGLPLTATLLTSPADGTLAFGSDGSFSYTPYSGYAGPDSFTYEATNGYASSAPTTVSITVIPPTLSWTEGVTGNWTDGAWGSGSSYPDNTVNATVGGSGSVVNVISDQAANALAIQSGGKVAVGPGAVLSVTTSTSVTGGGTLNVDANGLFSTGGTLILDSGGSLTGGRISAAAYQLNDGMVRANLTGPGGVTEDASSNPPGTVLLSGSNSYPGPTVVNAGTLVVTGMNALPDGTSLTVGAGATFLFDPSQVVSISPVAAIVVSAPGGAAASDASTPVEKAVPPSDILVAPPTVAVSGFDSRIRAFSASAARDVPAAATSVPEASFAIDAVFTSHRTALLRLPRRPIHASPPTGGHGWRQSKALGISRTRTRRRTRPSQRWTRFLPATDYNQSGLQPLAFATGTNLRRGGETERLSGKPGGQRGRRPTKIKRKMVGLRRTRPHPTFRFPAFRIASNSIRRWHYG